MIKFDDLFDLRLDAIYHNFLVALSSRELNSKFNKFRGEMGLLPDSVRESDEYRTLNLEFMNRNKVAQIVNSKVVKDPRYKEFRKKFDTGEHIRLIRLERVMCNRYFDGEENLLDFKYFIKEYEKLINDESVE